MSFIFFKKKVCKRFFKLNDLKKFNVTCNKKTSVCFDGWNIFLESPFVARTSFFEVWIFFKIFLFQSRAGLSENFSEFPEKRLIK